MNVFKHINKILDANPETEELVCVFVTDGEDCDPGYRSPTGDPLGDYQKVSNALKARPGLRSKFLSVGFSEHHDAAFMNRIAKFGSEIGNFVFIDTGKNGWKENFNQTLLDQLDIALESASKAKLSICNAEEGFEKLVGDNFDYILRQSEELKASSEQPQ